MRHLHPLLSVIVPVYNTERYLTTCLESILDQIYSNIEVIVVDDGSTDESGKICDEIAKRDSRVTVIHKDNAGLSSARNIGIQVASGKYIAFVDSDDFLDRNCYKKNIDLLEKYDADVCCYDIFELYPENITVDRHLGELSGCFYAHEFLKELFALWPLVWAKVYRRDFLNFHGLRFIDGILYEDNPFVLGMWIRNPKIVILNEHLHYYRMQRPGAITGSGQPKTSDVFKMMDFVESDFKNNGFDREFLYLIKWSIGNIFWLYSLTPDNLKRAYARKMIAQFIHYFKLSRNFKVMRALLKAFRCWVFAD